MRKENDDDSTKMIVNDRNGVSWDTADNPHQVDTDAGEENDAPKRVNT